MNQSLTSKQVVEKLWCGTISNFKHDMLEHSLEFTVNVIDIGYSSEYKVIFSELLKLEIFYEDPENFWDYVELTEIAVRKIEDYYSIDCELWSSGGMKILCRKMTVNGMELHE